MNQTTLELDARHHAQAVDRDGFDIGWDHAHHGLVPPAELLLAGTPVCQGWMAGKAVFGGRTLRSTRHTRLWLQLRISAWRQGVAFEGQQLTPNYLAQIEPTRCPVTRWALQGARGQDDTLVVERLNADAGYAAGNVAVVSQGVAQAWQGLSVQDCVRQAHRAQAAPTDSTAPAAQFAPGNAAAGLPAAAWWRMAALRSFATPLPFALAAGLPLAVLPPNRVRLLNAVQGLQALLTRSFAAPRWAERCRRFASWLPEHTLRLDFNLFVGAMAPRVLEAGNDPAALRQALEDAWLNERVQRRWQHFALQLGEAATEALLKKATEAGLAGVRTLHHAPEQATDGWALPLPLPGTPCGSAARNDGAWPMTSASTLSAPRRATPLQPGPAVQAHPAQRPAQRPTSAQALLC